MMPRRKILKILRDKHQTGAPIIPLRAAAPQTIPATYCQLVVPYRSERTRFKFAALYKFLTPNLWRSPRSRISATLYHESHITLLISIRPFTKSVVSLVCGVSWYRGSCFSDAITNRLTVGVMTSGRGRATNRIGVGKYRMTTYFALLEIVIIEAKEMFILKHPG